jgi:hypothetical protein
VDTTPDAALFVLALVALMAVLSLAALGLVATLRWLGVDLSAWDDPPTTCPCIEARPCVAHPWRYDFDAVPPRPWKAW